MEQDAHPGPTDVDSNGGLFLGEIDFFYAVDAGIGAVVLDIVTADLRAQTRLPDARHHIRIEPPLDGISEIYGSDAPQNEIIEDLVILVQGMDRPRMHLQELPGSQIMPAILARLTTELLV